MDSIVINQSSALVTAGNFLKLKQAGMEGLAQWNAFCAQPQTILTNIQPKQDIFRYLLDSFNLTDNRQAPTFRALNDMATILHQHVRAMLKSPWFSNELPIILFEDVHLAEKFKLNVFDLLLQTANNCVTRSWSIIQKEEKGTDIRDWTTRQRALFLLGLDENEQVTGINIVGRDTFALKEMFHPSLLRKLKEQRLQFQELKGFKNLIQSPDGGQVVINAMRSLLLLDGTASSAAKVLQLDNHPRNTPVTELLLELIGTDLGYVLTGDNITKMMLALYRIRCGLPVIAFGEAGVGKSALFRFLLQSLLGHEFQVCNVNSGTTVLDVDTIVKKAVKHLARKKYPEIFLFFDEMNTADPPVIAFFKELIVDRHCNGTVLPEKLHILAAANPFRILKVSNKETTAGLTFRFAKKIKSDLSSAAFDVRKLVYRVNKLPVSFTDDVYDFDHLCEEAENTYIEEICHHSLQNFSEREIKEFYNIVKKSHHEARKMSPDPNSAVSLRDASRAAQLFRWFKDNPAGRKLIAFNQESQIISDLCIYLVYAFRFEKREEFLKMVLGENQTASENMTKVSRGIAQKLYDRTRGASIGSGAIALNDALCENLFALYVCVLNGIFLIIVGRPGSSKSLSVEILKMVLSDGNITLREELGGLPSLTEHYFQCSPLSTSSGFKALFESAQRSSKDPNTLAMVVLDELGLADLSPEKPIKILHSVLERKAILTSGEQQQFPYSVVALSNWVVDAAQVNRGILISRTKASKKDLEESAKELAKTLINKYVRNKNCSELFETSLQKSLDCIIGTYYELMDSNIDIGGDHFFSMRDFFFCVKNFVGSILEKSLQNEKNSSRSFNIKDHQIINSIIRNFGGHHKAEAFVRERIAKYLFSSPSTIIETTSPLNLIVQNINDSSKQLSDHIARHLMVLNRSQIGLQLLNRNVRQRLDKNLAWHVLFGSCFPDDLQIMAVTRKLRQVEQAIRAGGVVLLCHADQLFESLYIVLNQQYWSWGEEIKFTQIALGPTVRPIALPDGPFRIIALQDTDTALNRNLMSPAILSRFEKYELRTSHLLGDKGQFWLDKIESHPVWMAMRELIKRKKLLYGYHEESFATLALNLQEADEPMEVGSIAEDNLHIQWMRAVNPMTMIKLESGASSNGELLEICRYYRMNFILDGIDDALNKMSSSRRMIFMTNTLRHLELSPRDVPSSAIRLFDIKTELELYSILDSSKKMYGNNPTHCIFIQHDAMTSPIEQFHITKYEIENRMEGTQCRIVFIIHIDPNPVNMRWAFSFGDGWDYAFVDEVVTVDQARSVCHQRVSLKELTHSLSDRKVSDFIKPMNKEAFRSLILEMLGPSLQTSLSHLRSSLGQFYSGVKKALWISDNERLIQILKECLLGQLEDVRVSWNVVDVVSDPQFDASSSLTEGLWGFLKHKISIPLAHLLLTSDVWRVFDSTTMSLWCDFVDANYPERLLLLNSNEKTVQIPVGFRFCRQPFGRLLVSYDTITAVNQQEKLNEPLHWLLRRIGNDTTGGDLREEYFRDWFLLHIPSHLHSCLKRIPLAKMADLVEELFDNQESFFEDWNGHEAEVVAALELGSIAMFNVRDISPWDTCDDQLSSWKLFSNETARSSIEMLSNPMVFQEKSKWVQSISSIERSPALCDIIDSVEDLSWKWLGLKITKRIFLFDPNCQVKLPDLSGLYVEKLIDESLTDLVIESVISPRLLTNDEIRPAVRVSNLNNLLNHASECSSPEALSKKVRTCPSTNSLVPFDDDQTTKDDELCPCCNCILVTRASRSEVNSTHHLTEPDTIAVETLFQDYQKFLFFFERVAELFVYQRRNHPQDVRDFLSHLLKRNTRLRVSWRFIIVVIKNILSNKSGSTTVDRILTQINCNAPNELHSNLQNFLRALLVRADEEVRCDGENDRQPPPTDVDWTNVIMTNGWTVDRIRRLALIRQYLTTGRIDVAINALTEWAQLKRNEYEQEPTEAFLFFVLNFSSSQGDEMRLGAIYSHLQNLKELNDHPIVGTFIKTLSPCTLGVDLLPAGRSQRFERLLVTGPPYEDNFHHYPLLQESEPDWAPYIARLALHSADVAEKTNIHLLSNLVSNPDFAAQCYLPGTDNHPFLPSFLREAYRWYICSCGAPNCVGDCGRPTPQSFCLNCRVPLAVRVHVPRPGVRTATILDFEDPRGLATSRVPSSNVAFTVRNKPAVVTRFCLLLNSLLLMNATLDCKTSDETIVKLLRTALTPMERNNEKYSAGKQITENRRSLIQFLSNHIQVHLKILSQLLLAERPNLTRPDQFRIGHLLLHRLLYFQHDALKVDAQQFANNSQAREGYENALSELLARERHLETELDKIVERSGEISRTFRQKLRDSETSHWTYAGIVSSNRLSVQLIFAREEDTRKKYPFLNLLLDENCSKKLNALQHFGGALRFIALVRTVLQNNITMNEAINRMTIDQGLEKITEAVEQKAVLLDRGRAVSLRKHVQQLFDSFKLLWNSFSQIPNMEQNTFLDYFECQQVDGNIRPKSNLEENAPLILILAGTALPETKFAFQLLQHAVDAATSISEMPIIQSGCRSGSRHICISFSNAADLADFDDSLLPHVSVQEVDRFLSDHVIEKDTLGVAESFAMAAVLGTSGNTIAQGLFLDDVGKFFFKEEVDSDDFLSSLERRFLAWQPTSLPTEVQERIIVDLEKNRCLTEAKEALVSTISYLLSNTEPLFISNMRQNFIADILEVMERSGILTERHLSETTKNVLNRHIKLEVCHAIGLLKEIVSRIRGDDIFGGRIPTGWDTNLDDRTARITRDNLRNQDIIETLLQMANNISSSEKVPDWLSPDKSLLLAIRLIEGDDCWDGIQPELKMEHLGHVLLLAESLLSEVANDHV